MGGIARVLYPETIEQALAWLADPELKAAPLAGGTAIGLRGAALRAETLVDVTRLGLDRVRSEGGQIVIGATTRIQAVKESRELARVAGGILRAAVARIGSRLTRNAATVGGALVHVGPWSDLPVAAYVLDAEVEIASAATPEPRRVAVDLFFERHPSKLLKRGDLVTALRVRASGDHCGGAFFKFARTEVDDALVSAAARIELDEDGVCTDVRIALGAIRALPQRSPAAEAVLSTVTPTEERIAEAARAARDTARLREDPRASKDYRAEIVEVVVRRVLTECVLQAREGETDGE